jgi:hypothetical protein
MGIRKSTVKNKKSKKRAFAVAIRREEVRRQVDANRRKPGSPGPK